MFDRGVRVSAAMIEENLRLWDCAGNSMAYRVVESVSVPAPLPPPSPSPSLANGSVRPGRDRRSPITTGATGLSSPCRVLPQKGRSSSSLPGASASLNSRSTGGGGGVARVERAGAAELRADPCAGVARERSPSRGGQMTPSQPGAPWYFGLLRHLKSGARGLRLLARSSHILPPQTGQAGSSLVPAGLATTAGALGSRGGQITPSQPADLHL